jgi:hypothetical protein
VAGLPGDHLGLVPLVAHPEQRAGILPKCEQVMGPFQQYSLPGCRARQHVPVEPRPQRLLVEPLAAIGRQRLRPAQTGPRLWLGVERPLSHQRITDQYVCQGKFRKRLQQFHQAIDYTWAVVIQLVNQGIKLPDYCLVGRSDREAADVDSVCIGHWSLSTFTQEPLRDSS